MKSLSQISLLAVLSVIPVWSGHTAGQNQTSADSDSEGVKGSVEGLVRDIACPIQNKKAQ